MHIGALSILIPTYNDTCGQLVEALCQQAEQTCLSAYEVIVADDGSTDEQVKDSNRQISRRSHCQYIERPHNTGRAAIRNFLVQQARYDHLLLVDGDMKVVRPDYLQTYIAEGDADVIDGGVVTEGQTAELKGNLRFLYEKSSESEHTAEKRQGHPYRDFHTANFLIKRSIMLAHPFDERFRYYGYEDVLLGKQLRLSHIPIRHIDNPLGFGTYEDNADFVAKTEEGLRTLHTFSRELKGYSRLLTFIGGIHLPAVLSIIRLSHRLFGRLIRHNLCSKHPMLPLFRLYKLGYYTTL